MPLVTDLTRWGAFWLRAVSLIVLAPSLGSGFAHAQLLDPRLAEPEMATGRVAKPATIAQRHMIVTANPYATAAGLEILRAGGSAVDAGIAAQLVLALVEPQSSGLGGGAFLLNWDAHSRTIDSVDGRETAPKAARPDRFLQADGRPRPFSQISNSPLSVGVPGVVRALALAHERHGKLPWASLFAPAITLADGGFIVSTRLATLLAAQGADAFNHEARALFFSDSGRAIGAGQLLRNSELAATLRDVADRGADAFYLGGIASEIVLQLATASGEGGDMTLADLADYAAKSREPVCARYRDVKVCSMGAPSSGAVTMGMALAMIEKAPPSTSANANAVASDATSPHVLDAERIFRDRATDIARLVEAEKLAFADRDQFIADPDFVAQTVDLLDPTYLAERAKLIDIDHPAEKAAPGIPPMKTGALEVSSSPLFAQFGRDETHERSGTSHLSVIDDEGNAFSMTTSIQTAFGSGIMAGGFLLNSQLTDFSFRPMDTSGHPIANRVEGGKRPRSSMAPTIILDATEQPVAVLGSPGGSRIILYNLKAIVCLIDWHCDAETAAALPNFGSRNGALEVERETVAQTELGPAMTAKHGAVSAVDMTSGLAIIERREGHLRGAADPRREGTASGD